MTSSNRIDFCGKDAILPYQTWNVSVSCCDVRVNSSTAWLRWRVAFLMLYYHCDDVIMHIKCACTMHRLKSLVGEHILITDLDLLKFLMWFINYAISELNPDIALSIFELLYFFCNFVPICCCFLCACFGEVQSCL